MAQPCRNLATTKVAIFAAKVRGPGVELNMCERGNFESTKTGFAVAYGSYFTNERVTESRVKLVLKLGL